MEAEAVPELEPASRKLSVPRKFSGPPLVRHNVNKDELTSKVEAVPEGIVKGFGGAFEKTIAALALDASRSRGSTPLKTPAATVPSPEKNASSVVEKDAKESNPPAARLPDEMLDSLLMRKWFLTAAKDDTCNIKRMAREEPRLVRVRDIGNGYTALHWASHHGNIEVVRFLVDGYQANVAAKSRAGYTPLHIAYMRQQKEMIQVLLENCEADPGEFDYSGKVPSQYRDRTRQLSQKAQTRQPVVNRKPTTLSTAISSSMRRVGSFNAKIRSSVMKRMGKSHSNLRPSSSFPDRVAEDQEAGFDPDFALMPPPSTVRAVKNKKRPGSDLIRRGSVNSDVSRSDSVISIDEGSGNNAKTFDSGSDSVSFHESESYDSFVSGTDSTVTTPVSKHSSPLVYTKALNSPDGGSQV